MPAAAEGDKQDDSDVTTSGVPDDIVLAFRTLGSRAQGRIVRLGATADEILSRHHFPEPVSRALGEALALAAMLGSLLHTTGRLILQSKTDGPLNMLVVDYNAPGLMRATAGFDAERVSGLSDDKTAGQGQLQGISPDRPRVSGFLGSRVTTAPAPT